MSENPSTPKTSLNWIKTIDLHYLRKFKTQLVILLVCIVVLIVIFPLPVTLPTGKLTDYSFENALSILSSQKNEITVNSPTCDDKILHHGQKTDKVIVLYHGFTNCPAQFDLLARQFWEKGYNVISPRLPYHGNADRLNNDVSKLTTTVLINKANMVMSVAKALGNKTEIASISAGATVAMWATLNFKVSKLLIIAPLIAPKDIPLWTMPGVRKILSIAPNYFKWWDENTKAEVQGPKYAYPRFSTKAILAFFQLNQNTLELTNNQAKKSKLTTQNTLLLLENDLAINNQAAKQFTELLNPAFEKPFDVITLGSDLKPEHDIIDPNQPKANPDLVYPKILEVFDDK
jgi:esterase/lipase